MANLLFFYKFNNLKILMKKSFIVLSVILLFLTCNSIANNDSMIQEGEYLLYEVSFMGIKLGSIEMITEDNTKVGEILTHKVKSIIKSYSGIPFVDLDVKFESWIDPSITHPHQFVAHKKMAENKWDYERVFFDYNNKHIMYRRWSNKQLIDSSIIHTNKKWNDGSALFYFARRYSNLKKTIKVGTIIEKDTAMTTINFRSKTEGVKIDALDYEIRCRTLDGVADWDGLYGMRGKFEGWFSDDAASVPIVAKLFVYVGKVKIELKKWDRKGWTPPKN